MDTPHYGHDRPIQAVRVAKLPAELFEEELGKADPATVSELAALGTEKRQVPEAPAGFKQATQVFGDGVW